MRGKRYEWIPGSPFQGDPEEVGKELERIHKTGDLSPEVIVVVARMKGSPLHPLIYDGTSAEEALKSYHLDRARSLIKSLNITIMESETETIHVNAFHRVVTDSGRAWIPAKEVRANPTYSAQVERRLIREMRGLKNQLDQWQVYQPVSAAIEGVLSA